MKVTAKYGTVIIRICALHFTHLHTHTPWTHTPWTHTPWTHTPWTHTRSSAAPGEQLGVRCLAQGSHLSRVIEDERALYIHSPPLTYNPCRAETQSQPLDYESDSLPLGHDYSVIFQFHKETCSILSNNNKNTHFIFIICLKSLNHEIKIVNRIVSWVNRNIPVKYKIVN